MWLCDIILEGLENYDLTDTCAKLDNLYGILQQSLKLLNDQSEKEILQALMKDIKSPESTEGQIYKAFSKDEWFHKWGVPYLRAIIRAHQTQTNTNCKDYSIQHYGGFLYKAIKPEVEDMFSTIPLPQPSLSSQPFQGSSQTFYSSSTSDNSRGGPCVDGDGLVQIFLGNCKKVSELKKGDYIINSDGNVAKIVCIIKTAIENNQIDMVSMNGIKITPYHPVRVSSKWYHPINLGTPIPVHCDWVYNFVLDKHHIITINDVDVIGLGHGINDNAVSAHDFFGTDRIIEHLKEHPGWEEGLIIIEKYSPKLKDGLVDGF